MPDLYSWNFEKCEYVLGRKRFHSCCFPRSSSECMCNFWSRSTTTWSILPPKVIYPRYYKHWLYTLAYTFDCVCFRDRSQATLSFIFYVPVLKMLQAPFCTIFVFPIFHLPKKYIMGLYGRYIWKLRDTVCIIGSTVFSIL